MALVSGTDTYADLSFANTYIAARLHAQTGWSALTDSQKESALVMAMLHLDWLYSWKGQITEEDQGVNWPRSGVYDNEGREIDDEVIPTAIKKAQCELAIQWAANDQLTPPADFFSTDDTTTIGQVKREKLGELEREYYKNDSMIWELQQGHLRSKVYPLVEAMVRPYILRSRLDINAELMLF